MVEEMANEVGDAAAKIEQTSPSVSGGVSPGLASSRSTFWSWRSMMFSSLAAMLGMLGGLGAFTFGYGHGASYFSNNPQSCANCHIMHGHLDSWEKSSHAHVAVCNDCHLPHHSVGKWLTKADNGFFHSLAFTLDNYHEPIQIKPRNQRVTQNACIDCHREVVHESLLFPVESESLSCIHCHSDAGHSLR